MRIIFLVIILGIVLTGNTQNLSQWQIGLNVNPFLFNRIEKSNILKNGKQNFPNGFGFGLTLEKNWNEKFGIKTGVEYCTQNQLYIFKYNPIQQVGNNKIDATVSYFRIPVSLQYSKQLNDVYFITIGQGIQYSMLINFKVLEGFENDSNLARRPDEVYKNNLIGSISTIGIKRLLSERFFISLSVRYEIDFTKADNTFIHSFKDINFGTELGRNSRIGLEFGIQYHFSLDNVRFNKNPK